GAGACRKWASGTVCVAAGCTGTTYTPARTCNGTGTCSTVSSGSCSPYACGTGACKTSCTVNADCDTGRYCAAGSCVSTKALGAACAGGGECSSGSCVDGVCCESACGGACQACVASKTTQSDGLCRPVSNNTDPDNECAQQAQSSCGTDGVCDGAGACRKWASGTVCVAAGCTGTTYTPARTCNGA